MTSDAQTLPLVILLGDSIRLGYAPLVAQRLSSHSLASVLSYEPNGADTANTLTNLAAWAIAPQPRVVHFNCGLHDLKLDRATGAYQVPLDRYRANLEEIVRRLRAETDAALIFATTTPILDARHAARGASFDRFQADVERYNVAALDVITSADVPVNDLHAAVQAAGPDRLLSADGTHYAPEGYALLADTVAAVVNHTLTS